MDDARAVSPRPNRLGLAFRGATAPLPSHIAPPPPGFVVLFQTIEALQTLDRSFVIQFVAAETKSGTSTIAAGFARAAAAAYRRPVLLIDACLCPPMARSSQVDAQRVGALLDSGMSQSEILACAVSTDMPHLFRAKLTGAHYAGQPLYGPDVQYLFDQLRETYYAVVIDCPAIDDTPEAFTIARFCDGTALVAAASTSTPNDTIVARDLILQVGGQVLGLVFNREQNSRRRRDGLLRRARNRMTGRRHGVDSYEGDRI